MMVWFKLSHDAINDPKWPCIARMAKAPVGTVLAIWIALLSHASKQKKRGRLEGFDPEIVDALFGYKDGTCSKIMAALEAKGLIKKNAVVNWKKWQGQGMTNNASAPKPPKEAMTSTERSRLHREKQRQKAAAQNGEGVQSGAGQRNGCNADATKCNGCNADATQCNENCASPLKEEEIREDKTRGSKAVNSPEASSGQPAGGGAGGTLLPGIQPAADPVYITLPVVGKSEKPEYEVRQSRVEYYAGLYPGVDMRQEFSKMLGWLNANPKNRKTEGGIERFINGWLAKAQNSSKPCKEGGQQQNARPAAPTVYQQRMQDNADMARMCLEMRRRAREDEQRANTAIAC